MPHHKSIFFLGIAAFILTGAFFVLNPKVTDPNDPKFQISEFKIEDYHGPQKLRDALRIILPAGSDKKTVEDVLMLKAGATIYPTETDQGSVTYVYSPSGLSQFMYQRHYGITASYDKNQKLKEITVNGQKLD